MYLDYNFHIIIQFPQVLLEVIYVDHSVYFHIIHVYSCTLLFSAYVSYIFFFPQHLYWMPRVSFTCMIGQVTKQHAPSTRLSRRSHGNNHGFCSAVSLFSALIVSVLWRHDAVRNVVLTLSDDTSRSVICNADRVSKCVWPFHWRLKLFFIRSIFNFFFVVLLSFASDCNKFTDIPNVKNKILLHYMTIKKNMTLFQSCFCTF